MKLDPALRQELDSADLRPLLGQEVLLRVFVEHRPEGGDATIEPTDLPYLLLLENREAILAKLDELLEANRDREGTVVSMEIRPMPPLDPDGRDTERDVNE